jgi:hypothetical protein
MIGGIDEAVLVSNAKSVAHPHADIEIGLDHGVPALGPGAHRGGTHGVEMLNRGDA